MSLLKNSTILIAGVVISNLLAYAFHFIAGRMLGPEKYGEFGALMSLLLIMALPSSALGFAISKYSARLYFSGSFGELAIFRKKMVQDVLIFSSILLILIIIFSQFISNFLRISSIVPVIIVGIALFCALILSVNKGVLLGMKKFKALSLNSIIEAFSRLVLLILFLSLGLEVNGTILGFGLAYFIAFLLIFLNIKEINVEILPTIKIDFKPVYKFILQVLVLNILLQSIINLPALFIKHFYSSEFTGYWTAALNIARISLFISGSVSMVMFPEISAEKDVKRKKQVFYKAIILIILVSLGMAVLFLFISKFLVEILYGSSYLGAVPILNWMGFAMILIGLLQIRIDYALAKLN